MNADNQAPKFAVEEIVTGPGGFTFVVKGRAWVQAMWAYKCAREGETEDIFTFPEILLHPVAND
jgi:hypothetical protein